MRNHSLKLVQTQTSEDQLCSDLAAAERQRESLRQAYRMARCAMSIREAVMEDAVFQVIMAQKRVDECAENVTLADIEIKRVRESLEGK